MLGSTMPEKRAILVGTSVHEAMTTEVVTSTPDDTLFEAARVMRENRVSGLPVIAPDRTVLGIISERDLVRELHRAAGIFSFRGVLDLVLAIEGVEGPERLIAGIRHLKSAHVREAMSPRPVTVESDDTLSEALRLMGQYDVNRLPVILDGRLAGIITRSDVLRAIGRGAGLPPMRSEVGRAEGNSLKGETPGHAGPAPATAHVG